MSDEGKRQDAEAALVQHRASLMATLLSAWTACPIRNHTALQDYVTQARIHADAIIEAAK